MPVNEIVASWGALITAVGGVVYVWLTRRQVMKERQEEAEERVKKEVTVTRDIDELRRSFEHHKNDEKGLAPKLESIEKEVHAIGLSMAEIKGFIKGFSKGKEEFTAR